MKFTRRIALAGMLSLALLVPALAVERIPFDQAAFEAAQTADEPILVHVTADWCGICQYQKALIEELGADPALAAFKVFNIDYDSQQDALRTFRAQFQSTLIVFKGANEIGRTTGESDPGKIRALLEGAL